MTKYYKKHIIKHPHLYVASFTKKCSDSYIVYIHGGPGSNSSVIEYLIETNNLFSDLKHNIILFDQRNCGRSQEIKKHVRHEDNIHDLINLMDDFQSRLSIQINALIGHSYGAKLLYDFYVTTKSYYPGVFVSSPKSIVTPRFNNLIMDLFYLKKYNPKKYIEIYNKISHITTENIWAISENLEFEFHENAERQYLYWANLEAFEYTSQAQKLIQLPINTSVFKTVRESLYANNFNLSVDITALPTRCLWINGIYDYISNDAGILSNENNVLKLFYKSAHYPHIEENSLFCKVINEFCKT